MKHYRVNKLAKANGLVIKKKDILAKNDREAMRTAQEDDDCPVCDVMHEGNKVGSVL